jgi:hypothetical protein
MKEIKVQNTYMMQNSFQCHDPFDVISTCCYVVNELKVNNITIGWNDSFIWKISTHVKKNIQLIISYKKDSILFIKL